MAKNKISEWSSTAANNTDIGGIDIAEGCAPSGINNAIREMMAQVKDMQSGTDADNFTVGGNLSVTGTTIATGAITANGGVVGNVTGNVTGNASTATTATNVSGTVAVANGGTGVTTSTGTGSVVLSNSPTLVTPNLGTPSALVATNATGTANGLNAGLGVNQTWTDVTSSRSFGTTYTNSTGKPIQIFVSFSGTGTASITVNSVLVSQISAGAGLFNTISLIVPDQATYVVANVNGTTTKNNWSELR